MIQLSEEIHPLLTSNVVLALKKMSSATALEFLESNSQDICRHTTLTYSQIAPIRTAIISKFASPLRTADVSCKYDRIVPSGITNLDRLLNGGFRTSCLYELCGLSSTGKTQICMATTGTTISNGDRVFYIDSKRDLLTNRLISNLSITPCTTLSEALSKLSVTRPSSVYDLITVLHDYIEKQVKPPCLLVIDSLATLFFQHLADQNKSFSLLSSVKSLLNYIAVEMHTAVLVTNVLTWHSTEDTADDNRDGIQYQKAALGKFWSHAPTTRINTVRLGTGDILLTVVKSSNITLGTAATLSLTEHGFRQ